MLKKSVISELFKLTQLLSKTMPYLIFLLLFVSALLETISFLFFYPLFKIINGESIRDIKFIKLIEKWGIVTDNNEVYVILWLIFGIFSLKFLVTYITTVTQNNYLLKLRLKISHEIFANIVNQEIIFHGDNNKNVMLNNLTSQVHELIQNGLSPLFIFFAELVTLLLFVFAIFISIQTSILFILSIFIIFIAIIFILINRKVRLYGEQRQLFEESRINFIQNSLNSMLEIKIYEKEETIIKRYNYEDKSYFNVIRNQVVLNAHTRSIIEILVVFVFLFITYYFVRLNPGQNIMTSLGLLGVLILRALPSINKLSNCIQFFKYINPIVNNISMLLQSASIHIKKSATISITDFYSIELREIEYSYPGSNEILLKDVNIKIKANEIVGIKGESGIGKSTILNLIAGLIQPQYGLIYINNTPVNNSIRLGHILSYVPQKIFMINDTLRNNILFASISNDVTDEQIWKVLEIVELAGVVKNKFGNDLNAMINSDGSVFSGGQRQRIGLARALINNPKILILDEATSGIDNVTEKKIIKAIRQNYLLTILFISHSDNLFEICDKIYFVGEKTVKLIKSKAGDIV